VTEAACLLATQHLGAAYSASLLNGYRAVRGVPFQVDTIAEQGLNKASGCVNYLIACTIAVSYWNI
jgi:hypothetical protein